MAKPDLWLAVTDSLARPLPAGQVRLYCLCSGDRAGNWTESSYDMVSVRNDLRPLDELKLILAREMMAARLRGDYWPARYCLARYKQGP